MRIVELIEQLQQFDPHAEVVYLDDYRPEEIHLITLESDAEILYRIRVEKSGNPVMARVVIR